MRLGLWRGGGDILYETCFEEDKLSSPMLEKKERKRKAWCFFFLTVSLSTYLSILSLYRVSGFHRMSSKTACFLVRSFVS